MLAVTFELGDRDMTATCKNAELVIFLFHDPGQEE